MATDAGGPGQPFRYLVCQYNYTALARARPNQKLRHSRCAATWKTERFREFTQCAARCHNATCTTLV